MFLKTSGQTRQLSFSVLSNLKIYNCGLFARQQKNIWSTEFVREKKREVEGNYQLDGVNLWFGMTSLRREQTEGREKDLQKHNSTLVQSFTSVVHHLFSKCP